MCLKKDFCLTTVKSMDETAPYPKFRILSAFMITYPEVNSNRVNNKEWMRGKFVNSWEGINSVLVNWIKTKHLRRKNEYDTMRLCSVTPNEYRKMCSVTHLYRSTCSETPNEYRKTWSFAQLYRSMCSVTPNEYEKRVHLRNYTKVFTQ